VFSPSALISHPALPHTHQLPKFGFFEEGDTLGAFFCAPAASDLFPEIPRGRFDASGSF